jgi:hypothetical protein
MTLVRILTAPHLFCIKVQTTVGVNLLRGVLPHFLVVRELGIVDRIILQTIPSQSLASRFSKRLPHPRTKQARRCRYFQHYAVAATPPSEQQSSTCRSVWWCNLIGWTMKKLPGSNHYYNRLGILLLRADSYV